MHSIYKIMFWFSIGLTLAAIAAVIYFGLNLGTDFRGGSLLEIEFTNLPAANQIQQFLNDGSRWGAVTASPLGEKGAIVRLPEISEEQHQQILTALSKQFGIFQEKRFSSVGAVIGQELKHKSVTAMILVLLGIIIYIAFVFRKLAHTLSSWAMSLAAIVALLHDVLIPIGVFAVLGRYWGIEITAIFVAAVLTILGYSVSDTVVVFDRIRENVLRYGGRENFGQLVHQSIKQTLARSLNTTFTTLLSLVAIFLFGGESVKYFALALIIGIFLGAYSSIFVASPILIWWSGRRRA